MKIPEKVTREYVEGYVKAIVKLKSAIAYLDSCGEITMEKLKVASSMTEFDISDAMFAMWERSARSFPNEVTKTSSEHGGNTPRQTMQEFLQIAVAKFEGLAMEFGVSKEYVHKRCLSLESKSHRLWWQFWKR